MRTNNPKSKSKRNDEGRAEACDGDIAVDVGDVVIEEKPARTSVWCQHVSAWARDHDGMTYQAAMVSPECRAAYYESTGRKLPPLKPKKKKDVPSILLAKADQKRGSARPVAPRSDWGRDGEKNEERGATGQERSLEENCGELLVASQSEDQRLKVEMQEMQERKEKERKEEEGRREREEKEEKEKSLLKKQQELKLAANLQTVSKKRKNIDREDEDSDDDDDGNPGLPSPPKPEREADEKGGAKSLLTQAAKLEHVIVPPRRPTSATKAAIKFKENLAQLFAAYLEEEEERHLRKKQGKKANKKSLKN